MGPTNTVGSGELSQIVAGPTAMLALYFQMYGICVLQPIQNTPESPNYPHHLC